MKKTNRTLTTLLGIATCLSGQLKAQADGITTSLETTLLNNYLRLRGVSVADDGRLSKVNVRINKSFSKLPADFDFSFCRFVPREDADRGALTNDWGITASSSMSNGMRGFITVGQFGYERRSGANSNNFEAGVTLPNATHGAYGATLHYTPQWNTFSATLSSSGKKVLENGTTVTGKIFIRGFAINQDKPEFVAGYDTDASWQLGKHTSASIGCGFRYNSEFGTETDAKVKLKVSF